ncbi:helix-turn-helix domain-containing protein [Pedobacter frigidisoli]
MDETQILDVAKQLISHYGPQKTTMKDIAERLSISTPYL